MSAVILPPFLKELAGATREERAAALLEYKLLLVTLNPGRFLPVGVKRRRWHFRLQHPLT